MIFRSFIAFDKTDVVFSLPKYNLSIFTTSYRLKNLRNSMKKNLLTFFTLLMLGIFSNISAQNLIKQCTPGAFYYNCGAQAAHQSEQGPWFDFVINGNQNSWYQGYGVESATWKEYDNGTAQLTTRLYQIINKDNVKFDVNLTFSDKGASTPHGGGDGWHCLPNNTNDWYYYRSATGSITGVAGTHVQGVTFTATLVGGSALQIGTGGSTNSTTKYGMSAWLNVTQTGGWNVCWKKGATDLYFDLNNCNVIPPPTVCNNLTSGGTIGSNQSGCNPYISTPLSSIALPSGGDATKAIEYVWLKSTTYDGTAATTPTCVASTGATDLKGWSAIAGATGTTYDPGTVTQTTWYLRCSRRAGCLCYYGESNIVKITITGNCTTGCSDLTSGGTIGSNQSGCNPYISTPLSSIALPSGGDATKAIEYVWLKSTTYDGTAATTPTCVASTGATDLKGWSAIAGATGTTYDPGTVTQTTWYLRCSRRAGCLCYYGESNIVKITITGNCTTGGTVNCANPITPAGWMFLGTYNNNLYYKFTGGDQTYTDAQNKAASIGGCLPVIKDAAENTFLTSKLGGGTAWLGLQRSGNNWVSSNGTVATYLNWAAGEPNNAGGVENTATILGNGQWNDISSTSSAWAVAVIKCGNTTSCAVSVQVSNDGPKCQGQNIQLTATGTSNSTGGSGGTALGNNLVVNGSFEKGFVDFTTEIRRNNWADCSNGGSINIGSTPQSALGFATTCSDKDGNGAQLVVDFPAGDVWQKIWKQHVTVKANTNYKFIFWAQSIFHENPAKLFAMINDKVYPTTVLPTATCQWIKYEVDWNSGTSTNAALIIKNNNPDCHGNDFAIDAISLQEITTTTPTTCTPSYSWTGPNGFTSTQQNPTVNTAGTYTVTYKDQFCCTQSTSTTVVFNTLPTATITGNLTVCQGQTTTLTANGTGFFQWNNGAIVQSITVGAGTYSVEVTSVAGCKATASATVTETANPTATITGNLTVCQGQTTTLTANGTGSYKWSNSSTAQSITVGAGTYSVEVTSAAGCKATASATVTNTLFATTISGGTSVCPGKTSTLTANSVGSYKWSNGATTQSITVGVGTYTVEVTNVAGCKATASATITENPTPQVSITGNLKVCNNGTTSLTANATGTYTWSNGATTKIINVSAGTYNVTVSNGAGCSASASAIVTNSNTTVSISGEPTVCQNATTTLTANGTGTYAWSNGATTKTITVGAGTYSVTLTNAEGCTATNSITVTTKNCNTSSVGDFVFCDKNGNGVQDTGEPGIAGVTVTLTGTDTNGQPVTKVTTTDANGKYSFDNLAAGTYSVKFTTPNGYISTVPNKGGNPATDSDANPATGSLATFTLTQGQSNTTIDAGYYQLSSIGDYVFCDKNNNGIQDAGDTPLANVTVKLTGTAGDGTTVSLTTTTDANGKYIFSNLKPGTYTVNFAKPTGFNSSPKDAGGNDTTDSDADTNGNVSVTVTSGTNNTTVDAGFNQPIVKTASLGDFVFCDKNGNGIQDAGELGIAGVGVTLTGTTTSGQSVTLNTTTDANGKYVFANLEAGTYKVIFAKPAGYVITAPNKGTTATDSDADVTSGMTNNITLAAGESNTTIDAGFYQLSSVGDYVFCDKNNNGIQDAGDTPLANVTVKLTGTAGDGTTVSLTTTTDANGKYIFSNLKPGTYTVNFAKPTGFNSSPKDAGGNDTTDSDADTNGNVSVTVTSGTSNTTVDAGFNKPVQNNASIGDFVFCDKNNNGIQDAGEPGLAGVMVRLTGTDVNGLPVNLAVSTDANGKYTFAGLVAGTYKITFVRPTGYLSAQANVGSNDAIDSDADVISGMTNNITLAAGENNNSVDAGFFKYASIGDFVFCDKNKNGIQDSGETGLAGVTVKLNGVANGVPVSLVTTTDANGKYVFINLLPGIYTVTFVKPTGYTASPADQGTNDTADSDANSTTGVAPSVTLAGDDNNTTIDAGFYLTPIATNITIGDFVFLDCNKNGIQDAGEAGVANVKVTLKNATGGVVSTTTTSANGAYSFSVPAGSYSLSFAFPTNTTGLTFSPKDAGTNDAKDSDVDATGSTAVINFTTNDDSVDAGIIDAVAPTLSAIPADLTVACNAIPASPNVTASDNFDTAPIIMVSSTNVPLASKGQYLLKRSWKAVDKCGNVFEKIWTICVKDTEAPTFSNLPKDVTVECDAIPAVGNPTIKDNCDNNVSVDYKQTIIPGSCPDNYKIKRSWTAVDNAGNLCEHVQYITVQDTKAPVITGVPADVTIQCGQPLPLPPAPGIVKGTDNCDAYVTLTFSEIYYAGSCNGKSLIKCQWTAVDNCGNVSAKIWNITIQAPAQTLQQSASSNSIEPSATIRAAEPTKEIIYTNDDVSVFPNPTVGDATILLGAIQASRVNIVNGLGRIVHTIENPSDRIELHLSNGIKGLYTIQIVTAKGLLTKKLLIIE
jgi:5-hydroxyisourate hydrolase-like protein (transthyretin family)